MAPKNTQQGASAKGRRGARAKAASPSRARRSPGAPQSRRKVARKPRGRWVVPASILAICLVFVWTYYPVAAVQYREARQRDRLAAELRALEERNARLRGQVERLKTPAGVEDYARSQLGLVKQGESVVVEVDEKGSTKPPADEPVTIDKVEITDEPSGPWTAFLDLVFNVQ